MTIIIDIDENVFTRLFDNGIEDYEMSHDDISAMATAIRGGTPLPKGHGRLIDESTITEVYIHKTKWKEVNGIKIYPRIDIVGTNAPTIIEADKDI